MPKDVEVQKTVEPSALQVMYLDEIAGRLGHLESLMAKPKGYTHPIKATVNGFTIIDDFYRDLHIVLYAVTLYNDGPDDVFPSINSFQKVTPLKVNESVSFDYGKPCIKYIVLDVDTGKTANIRGFGIY
jgi:hypothetical protein